MTADPSITAGTPSAEALLDSINELCEAYANAQMARFLAGHSANHAEYENHSQQAAYWDTETHSRFSAVAEAVETVTPERADIQEFLPVRNLPNGNVEIHASDQTGRPFVLQLTGVEAVIIGVHLTTHAAIGLDRTGTRVDRVLPPMITGPIPATTCDPLPAPLTGHTPATSPAPIPR